MARAGTQRPFLDGILTAYAGERQPHMTVYWRPTATRDAILTAHTGDRQPHMTVYWRPTSTHDAILTAHVCNTTVF